jgi:hypothetical protein
MKEQSLFRESRELVFAAGLVTEVVLLCPEIILGRDG